MFAKRANSATLDGRAHTLSPADDVDAWEDSPPSFWGTLRSRPIPSRALLFAPLIVVGFIIVWTFRPEPRQSPPAPSLSTTPLPASSAPAKRPEQKVEVNNPPAAPRVTVPPPVRQEVVEAKPVKPPEPAAPVVASVPTTPLSRNEIMVLQGKLGSMGFAPGPIDGVVGPLTQAALRRYAESRGLPNADATRALLSRLEAEATKP